MSKKDEHSVQEYSIENTVVDDMDSSIQQVLKDEAVIKNPDITEELEHADELEDQPIDIVRSTVRTVDNPSLPVYTFRAWFLGTIFCILGAAVSQFYFFRSNSLGYSSFFVTLVSYPLGVLLARILPNREWSIGRFSFSLNPGPFNIKEHCLIVIMASTGGGSAYATDILAIQDLYYQQDLGPLGSILLLISTQCLGYGMAGFYRKFLVNPTAMLWPSTLPSVSLFNTFHEKDPYLLGDRDEEKDQEERQGMSRMRFFLIVFACTFVYELFPTLIFPVLSSVAVLCLIGGPGNMVLASLGSGFSGVGILNFGLDWNAAGATGPLFTPWWAQVNWYIGAVVMVWIVCPVTYFCNLWNAKSYPILTTKLFDKDGNVYNHSRVISDGYFNETAYEEYSPVYMTPYNAMMFALSFVALTASITHVLLYYGSDLKKEFWVWGKNKEQRKYEREVGMDIHVKMMQVYKEVPFWWYAVVFVVTIVISIIVCEVYPIHLPWWGLLVAIGVALLLTLPIGIIQAISGSQPGLNVITEMICGYMLPGRPIANVTFKCYGYMAMAQCLGLVSDLKLGLYMKIPPKCMFAAQFYGTILGGIVNYVVLKIILAAKRPVLQGIIPDPTGQWTGRSSSIFYASSIIWGAVGPARLFGPDSQFPGMNWAFLVGIVLPLPFWFLYKRFPKSKIPWKMVNVPVILGGAGFAPQVPTNILITSFICGFVSQFYLYRRHHSWWAKYNYVLSAALDSGTFICSLFIFICINGINSSVHFPTWAGNPEGNVEYCE
ncbi:hypothetical protein K450DRAFT_256344 [Umbelopsis ramanniana AG]|uniref:OPT family small oligopeptide transporter n=1 Tax=Umbelopsis ramanniana AG TaxID=1314678 RepID=A0AAD5E4B8_UMBRA|nr:uncharacterized protein K450DRAFT_256344 [Umbelopsis ramanniana AG]KAI8576592.1 hypothetical protein K450DRAFT_256344 [Umbelopsis ramanniana AG]